MLHNSMVVKYIPNIPWIVLCQRCFTVSISELGSQGFPLPTFEKVEFVNSTLKMDKVDTQALDTLPALIYMYECVGPDTV